ncbi:hypothetical protein A2318_02845 [Candidatus Uhrbacteria bacterium RIFOXYB2_FULL_45_11]|uniref:Uncharacterized protein n=1 Tax=Candidatus Uhrbacteria bacterium RIFOXYB2_FULL_45_11 TaxID=1802421 RepID=A0A1F7W2Y2_9BACT|nr:MAG: hypothetical protein A2318_02845 [Candidatus Uhrbacteria bacterium RIFOXYB2_FULL_45_11]
MQSELPAGCAYLYGNTTRSPLAPPHRELSVAPASVVYMRFNPPVFTRVSEDGYKKNAVGSRRIHEPFLYRSQHQLSAVGVSMSKDIQGDRSVLNKQIGYHS